jgi:hypothetical protein
MPMTLCGETRAGTMIMVVVGLIVMKEKVGELLVWEGHPIREVV